LISAFSPFAVWVDETGDLTVNVATTGDATDPDGYLVHVDGTQELPVTVDGSVLFKDLPAGEHALGLAGVARASVT
jgi:hypothetical protein